MRRKTLNKQFLFLQMLQMLTICISASFLSPILYSYHCREFTIGVILAVAALGTALLRPLIGYVNDRFCCARQIVMAFDLIGVACFYLLTHASSDALRILSAIGVNVALISMMSFVDSWAIRMMHENYELNYGLTRAGGSFSYAAGALAFGTIYAKHGYRSGSWVVLVLYCAIAAMAFCIPNPKPDTRDRKQLRFFRAVGSLCGNRRFMLMLLAFFLLTQTTCAIDNFQSVRILALGGTEKSVGIVLFLQSFSEMTLLVCYSRLKRAAKKPAAFWMAVGMTAFGIKALLLGAAREVWQIYLTALLQSVSFGIVTPAGVDFILETVDPSVLSTSHLCFQAIGSGAAMVVSNLFCGFLAEKCGTGRMFRLICLCAFVAALLALCVVRMCGSGRKTDAEGGGS